MIKVLMVCMENICRSPMAEAVTHALLGRAGLAGDFALDSAGTAARSAGELPDERAVRIAKQRGYELLPRRARKVTKEDFEHFDLIVAMDRVNLAALKRICPAEHQCKLKLFLDFADGSEGGDIPDPYYGGIEEFERAIELCEAAAKGFISICLAGELL